MCGCAAVLVFRSRAQVDSAALILRGATKRNGVIAVFNETRVESESGAQDQTPIYLYDMGNGVELINAGSVNWLLAEVAGSGRLTSQLMKTATILQN